MQQFYKPNSRNTGSACSFWVDGQKSIMSSLIKQASWNDKTRIGSFSENKDNPKAKVLVKLSPSEAAEIIDAIERNSSFDAYHRSSKQVAKINFSPYHKKQKQEDGSWVTVGDQLGFSYRISKEDADDSTSKISIVVGLNWGEARLLKMYLEEALKLTFDFKEMDYKPNNNYDDSASKPAPQKKAAQKTVASDGEEDLEW